MIWTGGLLAGLAGVLSSVPEYIWVLFVLGVLETLLDTVTGSICAWCEGTLKSRKVVTAFLVKVIQFGTLYGVFAVPVAISKVMMGTPIWQLLAVPALMILWVETVSNVENMYRMEKFGGVKFPDWAKSMITRLAKGLQVAAEGQLRQADAALQVTPEPERNKAIG